MTPQPANDADSPDLNLRVLQPLVRYLAHHFGPEVIARVAAVAGLSEQAFDGSSRWISHAQFEATLGAARQLIADDETFTAACAYKLGEAYGPFRFVLWAASLQTTYEQGARNMRMISAISEYKVTREGRTGLHIEYTSTRPESRLMCLSRLGQMTRIPTIWGYPAAQVIEDSCIGRGDKKCVYRVRLYERRRWRTILGGLGAGVAAAVATHFGVGLPPGYELASLPALGLLLGTVFELHRTNRANLGVVEEINEGLRQLAREDASARQELLALHHRERDWTRLMEEQVAERAAAHRGVLARIQELQEARMVTLRGFSHDLRNPLVVLRMNAQYLQENRRLLDGDGQSAVDDIGRAVDRMQRLLGDLMEWAGTPGEGFVQLAPQRLQVPHLTERIRRQLRAYVHGRDIRVSVFSTREAPETIETDLVVFDRVLDNLLTNAAKYTERGSIVVEVGGMPGFLTIKLSDSGRGIREDQLDRIFRAGGSEAASRQSGSYGIGLSIVVQLLAQVGGRLDVMSKPGIGTTFWIHLPVSPPAPRESGEVRSSSTPPSASDDPLRNVVTIRKFVTK
jgi:signal transduction histidine kinase